MDSRLQLAIEMTEYWENRGNRASEFGKDDLAERYNERSHEWRGLMNDLVGDVSTHSASP